MAITKAQWQQIESEMARGFVNIKFSYQGFELSIQRERKSESMTVLAVYIDGYIKGEWLGNIDDIKADAPSILKEVYCHKTIAVYKPAQIAKIEKIFGKRRAKTEWPNLHKKIVCLAPYFSKASVLCRQLKKLKGLEVIKADCLNNEPVLS
jgi:hypothetical protein